jgi:hypothetical protein
MAVFNYNAFILGALTIMVIYGVNVAYCLICIAYNIKILEFSFFFGPGFRIHRGVIRGTQFTLGWLPLGGYVKPLGMAASEEEKKGVKEEDLPYAFFNKPDYLKAIFPSVPFIVITFLLAVTLLLLNHSSLAASATAIYHYATTALQAMFTDQVSNQALASQTLDVLQGENVIVFAFSLLLVVLFFFNLGPLIMMLLMPANQEVNGVRKAVAFITVLFFLWICLWKIPMFVFSFFSLTQDLIYAASFSLGLFVTGVVFYFLTVGLVRLGGKV